MLKWAFYTLMILLMCSESIAMASQEISFYSGGKRIPLIAETQFRAMTGTSIRSAKGVPYDLGKAFNSIGMHVVPKADSKSKEDAVGIPVWFNRSKNAVGILTNQMIIRSDSPKAEAMIRSLPGFVSMRQSRFKQGLFIVSFVDELAGLNTVNKLVASQSVTYAHPNFVIAKNWRKTKTASPSDEPYFSSQWHLENTGQGGGTPGADIHVKEGWNVTTGSEDVVVAILHTGFEVTHQDLRAGWFINHDEIPGNNVDDDGNGLIDDVNGWNFRTKNGDITNGYVPDHGTAVAGLVGARMNGTGMTGVCPKCTMLPVSLSWEVADDAEAFYYAKSFGADVITNSWGYPIGTPSTDAVVEAINDVATTGRDGKGTIILFAMNNINQDDCIGDQPDISSLDSAIAVSAASDMDKKVSFSAWGNCMEILSPSYESGRKGIASTDLLGNRGYNTGNRPNDLPDLDYTNDFGGTSAATPIASGVFALMLSLNDNLSRDEALAMVLATADKIQPGEANYDPSGFSTKYGFGRINAAKALRAVEVFRRYSSKSKDKDKRGL